MLDQVIRNRMTGFTHTAKSETTMAQRRRRTMRNKVFMISLFASMFITSAAMAASPTAVWVNYGGRWRSTTSIAGDGNCSPQPCTKYIATFCNVSNWDGATEFEVYFSDSNTFHSASMYYNNDDSPLVNRYDSYEDTGSTIIIRSEDVSPYIYWDHGDKIVIYKSKYLSGGFWWTSTVEVYVHFAVC
jgi:hypothetical protein